MRFRCAVIHDGDFEPLIEPFYFDDSAPPFEQTAKCACCWSVAATAANDHWQARIASLLAGITPANVGERYLAARKAFHDRMRTMVDHPAYGQPLATCTTCNGTGRFASPGVAGKLDYWSDLDEPWSTVVETRITTRQLWAIPFDLWMAFKQHVDLPLDLSPDDTPELPVPLAGNGCTSIPVADVLARSAVPGAIACIDPSGSWHEREENEFAEDLAGWHTRLTELMQRYPTCQLRVLEVHA